MKLTKIFGSGLLFLSGYLVHFLTDSRLSDSGAIWVAVLTFFLVAIGLTATLTTDGKTFKKHLKDILNSFPL